MTIHSILSKFVVVNSEALKKMRPQNPHGTKKVKRSSTVSPPVFQDVSDHDEDGDEVIDITSEQDPHQGTTSSNPIIEESHLDQAQTRRRSSSGGSSASSAGRHRRHHRDDHHPTHGVGFEELSDEEAEDVEVIQNPANYVHKEPHHQVEIQDAQQQQQRQVQSARPFQIEEQLEHEESEGEDEEGNRYIRTTKTFESPQGGLKTTTTHKVIDREGRVISTSTSTTSKSSSGDIPVFVRKQQQVSSHPGGGSFSSSTLSFSSSSAPSMNRQAQISTPFNASSNNNAGSTMMNVANNDPFGNFMNPFANDPFFSRPFGGSIFDNDPFFSNPFGSIMEQQRNMMRSFQSRMQQQQQQFFQQQPQFPNQSQFSNMRSQQPNQQQQQFFGQQNAGPYVNPSNFNPQQQQPRQPFGQ